MDDSIMSPCTCDGGTPEHPICSHHEPGRPCANRMRSPVSSVTDPQTGLQIPGSERGRCQVCWDNYYDKVVDAPEEASA